MLALAVFGSLLGLFATVAALSTIWFVYTKWKESRAEGKSQHHLTDLVGRHFLRWTVFDAALFTMLIIGLLFLFVDLLAVYRDRMEYPAYLFNYLLSGFVFILVGIILFVIRLTAVLQLHDSTQTPSAHHHREPYEAHKPKERVKGR